MNKDKRSPLKDKPLRLPGQSIDEQREELVSDKLLLPFLIELFLCLLAGLEWWRYFQPIKPAPVLYTVFAAMGLGYCALQYRRVLPKLRALRLASEGEKAVGQYLEKLRDRGYQVFHDIVGEHFNIDHALIGPAGVFTVETKTRSKPLHGEAKVRFDGERISVAGYEPDRDPVVQAKAQSTWLRTMLSESTGKSFPTRPIILFPGWYIQQGSNTTRDIWVLEPKALPSFLENEPRSLSDEDIKLASFHLSRFIRDEERKRLAR